MIILFLFIIFPFLLGLAVEYLICRLCRRRIWRAAAPAILICIGVGIAVYRYYMWSSDTAVWSQLLFVPGLPAVSALLGLLAGWRIWRRLWRPRLIWDKTKE